MRKRRPALFLEGHFSISSSSLRFHPFGPNEQISHSSSTLQLYKLVHKSTGFDSAPDPPPYGYNLWAPDCFHGMAFTNMCAKLSLLWVMYYAWRVPHRRGHRVNLGRGRPYWVARNKEYLVISPPIFVSFPEADILHIPIQHFSGSQPFSQKAFYDPANILILCRLSRSSVYEYEKPSRSLICLVKNKHTTL